jgi:hypothetical protein
VLKLNNKSLLFENGNKTLELLALNINIKNSLKFSILFNPRKTLLNNFYKPIKINNKILVSFNYYFKIIKYRIISLINKYNLFKIK